MKEQTDIHPETGSSKGLTYFSKWQFYPKLLTPKTPRLHFSHTPQPLVNKSCQCFLQNKPRFWPLITNFWSTLQLMVMPWAVTKINPGMLSAAFPSFLVTFLPLLSSLLTGLQAFTTFQTSFHPAAKTTCKTHIRSPHSSAQCPPMASCHILGPSGERPTGLDCQDLNLRITIRICTRNSLVVQWLALHTSTARGTGSISG